MGGMDGVIWLLITFHVHTGNSIRLTLRFVLKERKKEQKGERMKVCNFDGSGLSDYAVQSSDI
jgi:hypothetical protein